MCVCGVGQHGCATTRDHHNHNPSQRHPPNTKPNTTNAPVQVHRVHLREQRRGHGLHHVRGREGHQPRERLGGERAQGRVPVPELDVGEVVDQGEAVRGKGGDVARDAEVGCGAVAEGEVVRGGEDLDAEGEVLVALTAHILLEGRRGCVGLVWGECWSMYVYVYASRRERVWCGGRASYGTNAPARRQLISRSKRLVTSIPSQSRGTWRRITGGAYARAKAQQT